MPISDSSKVAVHPSDIDFTNAHATDPANSEAATVNTLPVVQVVTALPTGDDLAAVKKGQIFYNTTDNLVSISDADGSLETMNAAGVFA